MKRFNNNSQFYFNNKPLFQCKSLLINSFQKKIIVIVFLIFFFQFLSIAQTENKIWNYPLRPGSEQWATLKSNRQMLDACQIPQEIMDALSTRELAEVCYNYPLYLDYTAYDDGRLGIINVINNFNGIRELCKREKGVSELVKIYKDYPFFNGKQSNESRNYDNPFKLPFLELLFANEMFIQKLQNEELNVLGKSVINNYEYKLANPTVYSLYNIKHTFLLGAVILEKQTEINLSKDEQTIIKKFIQDFNHIDENLLSEISKIIIKL